MKLYNLGKVKVEGLKEKLSGINKINLMNGCKIGLSSTMALITAFGFTGCGKTDDVEPAAEVQEQYETERIMVTSTIKNIKNLFSELDEDTIRNATLVLLIDEIAKEDENGKVKPDVISNFINIIRSGEMIDDYNVVLNTLENIMLKGKMVKLSAILPDEMSKDKEILSKIEEITFDINRNKDNKEKILDGFDKIYKLFVEEEKVDGIELRDLSFSARAIAESYAREAAYLAKDYITEEKYNNIDEYTNGETWVSYIKILLEKLSNGMEEKSEENVIAIFNSKQSGLNDLLTGKVNASSDAINNLVAYINLAYLESDKVCTKDRNDILGEDLDEDVLDSYIDDAIEVVDAIVLYNYNQYSNKGNEAKVIDLSQTLVNSYQVTEAGLNDTAALKCLLSCSMRTLSSINEETSLDNILINPYLDTIIKYITKVNINNSYVDEDGQTQEVEISYQGISNGVKLICDEIAYYTLDTIMNKNKNAATEYDSYHKLAVTNEYEMIQYLQNSIIGECEEIDEDNYQLSK